MAIKVDIPTPEKDEREKIFHFGVFLDKHPIPDLIYRFLIWFLIAFVLYYISQNTDVSGGGYIASAMKENDKGKYFNVLAMFGLMFSCIGMFFKHISLKLKEGSPWDACFLVLASFPQKIATDLIEASLSLLSGLLALIVYEASFKEYQKDIMLDQIAWFFVAIVIILFMFALLGCAFCLLKAKPGSRLLELFVWIPIWVIPFLYPTIIYFLWLVLWHFPD